MCCDPLRSFLYFSGLLFNGCLMFVVSAQRLGCSALRARALTPNAVKYVPLLAQLPPKLTKPVSNLGNKESNLGDKNLGERVKFWG